jgi:hypothetical protein
MATDFATATQPLPPDALAVLAPLDSPGRIQAFLDATPYNTTDRYHSPLAVARERRAHCFDGACFAAAALWRIGHPPRIVDLRAHNDDDHVIAVYQRDGFYGCVAKSNTTVLRFREPVYRSVRELVMSFFDFYYNLNGDKTLREFSRPLDLRRYDRQGWLVDDDVLTDIAAHLDRHPHRPVVTPTQIALLGKVDGDLYRAGLLGSDAAGLFQPG